MKNKVLTLSLALLCLAGNGFAQEAATEPPTPETASLPEVVVTATRTQNGRSGGVNFDVLGPEALAATQQNELEEALKGLPGVEIASPGGPGSQASIFIRGADSKNVLVLVDGVPVNDPSDANRSADIAAISLANIERIEVIRGSQSVLYGSNATAGVIQIFTKTGKLDPKHQVGMELGSYNTKKAFANSQGQWGALSYSLAVESLTSDGFSNANPRNPNIPQAGNTDEADGWVNQNISLKLGYQLTADTSLDLSLRKLFSDKKFDDFGPGYQGDRFAYDANWNAVAAPDASTEQHSTYDQLLWGLGLNQSFFDGGLKSRLSRTQADTYRVIYNNDGDQINDFTGQTVETAWQGSFPLGEMQEATLGLGLTTETMLQTTGTGSSQIDDVDAAVDTQSLWVQDQIFVGGFEVVAGLRQDQHEQFGNAQTYRVAPAYELFPGGTRLKASYGTGFRSPSLYELHGSYTSYGVATQIGNPDLEPETSTSLDYGVEQPLGKAWDLGLTRFATAYENRIDYVTDPVTWEGRYENVTGQTTIQGWETSLKGELDAASGVALAYTRQTTADPDGNPLARRAAQYAGFDYWTAFGNSWRAGANLKWVGARPEIASARDKNGNQVDELAAYSLVNLTLAKELGNFEIYGRLDNATDQVYEEAWSYQAPGRSLTTGVKANF